MADDDYGCRFGDLLPVNLAGFEDAVERGMREEDTASHSRLAWGLIRSSAIEELRKALDCDIFVPIAQAWGKVRELHEYTDPNKHPAGEISIVHLLAHDFPLSVHPVLVARIGTVPALSLRFTLLVQAHFESAALSIRDGCISAAALGEAWLTARLKYGGVDLHKKQESAKVKLPGRIAFRPPGIRIG